MSNNKVDILWLNNYNKGVNYFTKFQKSGKIQSLIKGIQTMGLFSYLFASDNKRNLNKIEKIVAKIDEKTDIYASMSDNELSAQTPILKDI